MWGYLREAVEAFFFGRPAPPLVTDPLASATPPLSGGSIPFSRDAWQPDLRKVYLRAPASCRVLTDTATLKPAGRPLVLPGSNYPTLSGRL